MFTGLIESIGTITAKTVRGGTGKLAVRAEVDWADLKQGESIAINGVCLTLERQLPNSTLEFHVLAETLARTNLGGAAAGSQVNLERALRIGDRLGGHLVSGHVDAAAPVISLKPNGPDVELRASLPPDLRPLLVEKGSIAIDGVSLTLVEVADDFFSVRLIPATLTATALKFRRQGELVNLETDLLGKYVRKQLMSAWPAATQSNITLELLKNSGW